MSPLISAVLVKSEYVEVDTTYNENTDLPNVTAFDHTLVHWVAVAHMRGSKEVHHLYAAAFRTIFEQCHRDHTKFKVGKTFIGVIMDWSDAERKGLEEAVGEKIAEKLLVGRLVHYTRSYQRVGERVSTRLHQPNCKLSCDAFCTAAKSIPSATTKSETVQCTLYSKEVYHLVTLQLLCQGFQRIIHRMTLLTTGNVRHTGWIGGLVYLTYACCVKHSHCKMMYGMQHLIQMV